MQLCARVCREAVAAAATSGDARFFLGTDSAPHARGAKECACGCAGVFSAHAALPLYAAAFEAAACSRQWRAGGIGKPRPARRPERRFCFAKIAKVTYMIQDVIQKRRAVSVF